MYDKLVSQYHFQCFQSFQIRACVPHPFSVARLLPSYVCVTPLDFSQTFCFSSSSSPPLYAGIQRPGLLVNPISSRQILRLDTARIASCSRMWTCGDLLSEDEALLLHLLIPLLGLEYEGDFKHALGRTIS